jgi:hypothetical protein
VTLYHTAFVMLYHNSRCEWPFWTPESIHHIVMRRNSGRPGPQLKVVSQNRERYEEGILDLP